MKEDYVTQAEDALGNLKVLVAQLEHRIYEPQFSAIATTYIKTAATYAKNAVDATTR